MACATPYENSQWALCVCMSVVTFPAVQAFSIYEWGRP